MFLCIFSSISNTRKWIYEKGHNQVYGVMDDDLQFVKRLPDHKPTKIPKSKKLIKEGFFLIFNTNNNDNDQKKIKTISVEIKKDETLTAGIK